MNVAATHSTSAPPTQRFVPSHLPFRRGFACAVALAAALCSVAAEDAYYHLRLSSLTFTDGTLPSTRSTLGNWQTLQVRQPYAVLDAPGEAYVNSSDQPPWVERRAEPATLSVRSPAGVDVTGRLFVARTNGEGMIALKFKIAATDARPDARDAFLQDKEQYYRRLQGRNIPGSAWFRHQAQEAAAARGAGATNADPGVEARGFGRPSKSDLEDAYDLFTGGRALSENLQLDRTLPGTRTAEETVAVSNLKGITVRPMDWKALIQDAEPALDPLAAFTPGDQHAVFFPTFQAMTEMIDEADANGTPVLQLLEPRSEDVNSRERYQKQLCLGLTEISRVIGPRLVASVAFTGSDPFLRVGTDLAVLFETRDPAMLTNLLLAQRKAVQALHSEARSVSGEIAGVPYTGIVSPDRSVCSYLASVSNVVYVSNSKVQLENLLRVAKGGQPALSAQDEYIFFRSRYPRGAADETAFVVLTDATIRRWCGPAERIADARRTRVAAVLAELQAAHADDLVLGKATPTTLNPDFAVPDAGEFRLSRSGVVSSVYGSLNFMTPISELGLTKVTQAEADAYQRWRDSYQRNWRQFFDPIAIRFSIARDRLAAELIVTPLIAASDYGELMRIGAGAEIEPGAGDAHTNALLHLAFAVNTQSKPVQDAGNFIGGIAPGLKASAFSWLGQSIALYVDDDPFWDRLVAATNSDDFMEENFMNLPLALHCEVKNPLGLATFLTALHAFVDQSAPRMTTWENLDYNGQAYVKVTSPSPGGEEGRSMSICYAASPRALIVTLSEPLLKRALDRQAAAAVAATNGSPAAASPWLGKNVAVAAERRFLEIVRVLTRDTYQKRLQVLAWNNLPILNEWKRLYPRQDPVAVHERLWGTKLLCPGGGTYVWNEQWATMESTVFGHPGRPKTGTGRAWAAVESGRLGITFENQGLSAKAVLNRNATP